MIWIVVFLSAAVVALGLLALRATLQAQAAQEEVEQARALSTKASAEKSVGPQTEIDTGHGVPLIGWVVPVTGASRSATFVLGARDIIGRSGSATVVVNDPHMSEEHAEIALTPDGFQITDLRSTSGVKINNVRVKRQLLLDNDALTLGKTIFRFKTTS